MLQTVFECEVAYASLQAQLRTFIPLMLKYSTGCGKPSWGKNECRPIWWPADVPWANVRSDVRTEDDKKKVATPHERTLSVPRCLLCRRSCERSSRRCSSIRRVAASRAGASTRAGRSGGPRTFRGRTCARTCEARIRKRRYCVVRRRTEFPCVCRLSVTMHGCIIYLFIAYIFLI